jgi:hypothetical protein
VNKKKIKKFHDFEISKDDFTECFQDFFDSISGLEIDSYVFDGNFLFVAIHYDDVVGDEGGNSVSEFRSINKSQALLISCLDRFTSMHECRLIEIDWSTNEVNLTFEIKSNSNESKKDGIKIDDVYKYMCENYSEFSNEEIKIIYKIGGNWKYDSIDTIQILKDRSLIKIKEHGSQITNEIINSTVSGWDVGQDDGDDIDNFSEYPQLEFKVKKNVGQCYVNNELYLSYKGIHKVVDIISPDDLLKKKINKFPYKDWDSDFGGIDDIVILVCDF